MFGRISALIGQAKKALGGIDALLLVSILAVVGGGWIFLELADEVEEGDTLPLDERILLAFRNPEDPADPLGGPVVEELVRDLTALGGVAIIGLVTAASVGFLAMDRKYHAAVLVLVATVGGQLLSAALKGLYDRPRPDVVPHLMHASQASFPSGHSLLAAVTYLTLGALMARLVDRPALKLYIIAVAALIAGMVGVSRVYLGVHYPTDVLAGWAVGLSWAILCWEVARRLQRRGMVEPTIEP
ncbi:phosphatase PAP2 family protein [Tautonia sociabilis]|uniref:Phosphatase PAP2 family protein n=1 Tax=Tautonia sociabilis TaxID=2080755 RepID=A0A432MII0_9BACT|nr:phosphatase PAP2 family protein [Tautonia sociabilis]RUL86956.1 phosphatase PAP2 family protein [Tautonia sociabilis]